MYSKKMLSTFAITMVAFIAMGSLASAESKIILKPKVDAFALFVDTSPSMEQTYGATDTSRIVAGLNALKKLNSVIPELGYQSALYSMPEVTAYSPKSTYNRDVMARGLASVPSDLPFFQSTPMGNGFKNLDSSLDNWPGKLAVIFVSDGLSNAGKNPGVMIADMSKKYGDRFCLHVISVADTAKGEALLKHLSSLTPCGVFVDASDLGNKAVLDKFAQDVFYTTQVEELTTIVPVEPVVQEKIVFRSLNFDFDKSQITDEMTPSLTEAAVLLAEYPNLKIMVGGHTDSVGSEVYNQALSERRAKSVAEWRAANGVDSERIELKGYGEMTPKYENNTKEGRKLNRRVEIDVEN